MVKLFYIYSRGKDFQLADSANNVAPAFQDMVFPELNGALKQLNTYLHIYPFFFLIWEVFNHIPPDPTGQLDILRHHYDSFCMYGAHICVFK